MEQGNVEPEWRAYLCHLPIKEDFKNLIAEVKDACCSEMASVQQNLKALAG